MPKQNNVSYNHILSHRKVLYAMKIPQFKSISALACDLKKNHRIHESINRPELT